MNVLIVKTSSMGDIIHTLPALTDAGKAHTDISFDWVIEEDFAEIPVWHKLVDRIIPLALRRWCKHPLMTLRNHEWQRFRDNLRARQYDFIIDVQGLIKSAVITRMAKGMRCGMDKHSAREPLAALFYQRRFSIAKNQHAITCVRQLFAQVLDYQVPTDFPNYGIEQKHLPSSMLTDNYLIFLHGTSRKNKLWPENNWTALAKLAAAQGYTVKLLWNNETEYYRAKRIAAKCNNVQVLSRLNLTEIAALLNESKGVVAVDTGLGHLAAALQVPLVSLYGVTDPNLICTYSKTARHIMTKTSNNIADISADEVWKFLQSIIESEK